MESIRVWLANTLYSFAYTLEGLADRIAPVVWEGTTEEWFAERDIETGDYHAQAQHGRYVDYPDAYLPAPGEFVPVESRPGPMWMP